MNPLKEHIDNGPYTVDDTGGIIDANTRLIGRSYLAEVDPDEQFTLALNFPSRVLAVLRERYAKALSDYRICAERESCGEMEATLDIAESLGFSREDITA